MRKNCFKIKKLLNQGISNQTFINQNNNFVRKSFSPDWSFLNRSNEIKVLKALEKSNSKYFLKLIDFGWDKPKNHFYEIKPYFPNAKKLNAKNLNFYWNVIFEIIKNLHQIKDLDHIKTFNYVAFYLKVKGKQRAPNKLFATKEKVTIKYFNNFRIKQLVLCHQDLHQLNFLITTNQKIFLIDFELAYLNHFLFDVASFITETLILIAPQKIKKWIQMWKLNDEELKILSKICDYQNLIWHYWAQTVNQIKPSYKVQKIIIDKEKFFLKNFVF